MLIKPSHDYKCDYIVLTSYPFMAAVMPFKSTEWEMLDTYFSLLVHKLPKLTGEDFTEELIESIDFDKYRLIKNDEKKIELENKNSEIAPIPVGTAQGPQEQAAQEIPLKYDMAAEDPT